jgi:hypothetical protein
MSRFSRIVQSRLAKDWVASAHVTLWLMIGILIFFGKPIPRLAMWLAAAGTLSCMAAIILGGTRQMALRVAAIPVIALGIAVPLTWTRALDWVEFFAAESYCQEIVDSEPAIPDQPKLIAFHMDDREWFANSPVKFETLVYDQSDEIAKPSADWSQSWRVRAAGRVHFHSILEPTSRTHVIRLYAMADHWYWVEQVLS